VDLDFFSPLCSLVILAVEEYCLWVEAQKIAFFLVTSARTLNLTFADVHFLVYV
jgi:hypothetical protein